MRRARRRAPGRARKSPSLPPAPRGGVREPRLPRLPLRPQALVPDRLRDPPLGDRSRLGDGAIRRAARLLLPRLRPRRVLLLPPGGGFEDDRSTLHLRQRRVGLQGVQPTHLQGAPGLEQLVPDVLQDPLGGDRRGSLLGGDALGVRDAASRRAKRGVGGERLRVQPERVRRVRRGGIHAADEDGDPGRGPAEGERVDAAAAAAAARFGFHFRAPFGRPTRRVLDDERSRRRPRVRRRSRPRVRTRRRSLLGPLVPEQVLREVFARADHQRSVRGRFEPRANGRGDVDVLADGVPDERRAENRELVADPTGSRTVGVARIVGRAFGPRRVGRRLGGERFIMPGARRRTRTDEEPRAELRDPSLERLRAPLGVGGGAREDGFVLKRRREFRARRLERRLERLDAVVRFASASLQLDDALGVFALVLLPFPLRVAQRSFEGLEARVALGDAAIRERLGRVGTRERALRPPRRLSARRSRGAPSPPSPSPRSGPPSARSGARPSSPRASRLRRSCAPRRRRRAPRRRRRRRRGATRGARARPSRAPPPRAPRQRSPRWRRRRGARPRA